MPPGKEIASSAVIVIVSGSDGRAGGNAFVASFTTQQARQKTPRHSTLQYRQTFSQIQCVITNDLASNRDRIMRLCRPHPFYALCAGLVVFCSRPEAASDVISGMAVQYDGMDVRVKLGDSMSNRSRDVRLPHFLPDTDTGVYAVHHIRLTLGVKGELIGTHGQAVVWVYHRLHVPPNPHPGGVGLKSTHLNCSQMV